MSDAKRYRTIVADPPWNVMGGPPWGGGASKPLPYKTMSVDEIAALPVRDLAADAAHLYLWTINAYLEQTYAIARAWGFKPSTLLTWTKPITGGGAWRLLPPLHGVGSLCAPWSAARALAGRTVALRLEPPARPFPKARRLPRHG